MMDKNPLNILRFLEIIYPAHPTRADNIVRMVGRIAAGSTALVVLFGMWHEDRYGTDQAPAFVVPGMLIGVAIYFLAVIIIGIRVIGENQKVSGFGNQIRAVAWHLFLYMFLPAFVITAVFVTIALVVTHGGH